MYVPYVLNVSYIWEKYAYFNVFYNVNEFYVFSAGTFTLSYYYQPRIVDILMVIFSSNRDCFRK